MENPIKTSNINLDMIERILFNIDNDLGENLRSANVYLFDSPLIPFKITNVYFAGATLFIDFKSIEDFSNMDVIQDSLTLSHTDESYGLFSGGIRHLLSIKALKSLESIMYTTHRNYNKKWN